MSAWHAGVQSHNASSQLPCTYLLTHPLCAWPHTGGQPGRSLSDTTGTRARVNTDNQLAARRLRNKQLWRGEAQLWRKNKAAFDPHNGHIRHAGHCHKDILCTARLRVCKAPDHNLWPQKTSILLTDKSPVIRSCTRVYRQFEPWLFSLGFGQNSELANFHAFEQTLNMPFASYWKFVEFYGFVSKFLVQNCSQKCRKELEMAVKRSDFLCTDLYIMCNCDNSNMYWTRMTT